MILVGLGNPGDKYSTTKHNFGYWVIDSIINKSSLKLKAGKGDYLYAQHEESFLVKPTSYMNHSGVAVKQILNYYKASIEDLIVTLTFGSYHDVDSSEMAFKIAGSMALKEAVKKASPVLLEPTMALEVVVPEDYLGSVMGDVTSRRGNVKGMDARGNVQVLNAEVPLSEMFGYATDLRSMTQGRAVFTMQFAHYGSAPNYIVEQLMEKFHGKTAI